MTTPATVATRLRTLHGLSCVEVRRQVLHALAGCLDADGVAFDRRVRVDGRLWLRDLLHCGASTAVVELHTAMSRLPDPVHGPRRLRGLPRRALEGAAFLSLSDLAPRGEFERSEVHARFFRPFGLVDQLRLFVLQGNRVVAWVGLFRTRGSPVFSERDRRRLQPLVPCVVDALIAADRLQADASSPADFVVRADGRIAHATSSAQRWLADESFRRALVERVRRLDRGDPEAAGPGPLACADTRIVRLDGDDGVRYLVNVARAGAAECVVESSLSARERIVAEAAAAGATLPEIARSLRVGVETVRTQMKSVYRKLDIASRVELVGALRR